jgi:predicted lipoprotein with Yx(FWY)xxD motif
MKYKLGFLMMALVLSSSLAWADDYDGYPAQGPGLTTKVTNDQNVVLVADTFKRTLYVFDPDQGQASPACNGACAEVWPPYLISAEEAAALAAPLGSIQRKSNKAQLTVGGRPVYTYAPDRKVGDDLGDGVGGVWHVIPAAQ